MQPTSGAFQVAIQGSHQAVCQCNVLRGGKIVRTLPIVSGSTTADRTSAQMRSFSCTLGDPDGTLTPTDMASLLAPFGTQVELFRGVRLKSVTAVTDLDNDVSTWSQGTNNGTTVDPVTGDLILAWGQI